MIKSAGEQLAHWLPAETSPPPQGTVGDYLRRNAAEIGDRPAIKWPEGEGVGVMSWAELLERAERGARWILEHAEMGDRIAAWSTNRVDYAVLIYASAVAGTIITPFNQAWTDAETGHALRLTEPTLLFVGPDGRRNPLRPRAEAIATCPIVDLDDFYDLAPVDPALPLPEFDESHPYLIQFTSGTTGRSKGALLSHRAGMVGGRRTQPEAIDSSDVWLVYLPFHHIGGTVCVPLAALAVGGSYTVLERFDVDQIVRLIEPTGATQLSGVPTMWVDKLRHPDLPRDMAVREITLGGAAVPAALVRGIEARTGGSVAIIFGQSECPSITRTRPDDDEQTKAESIGWPVAHAEVKIVDPETGATLTCGEVGEILIRGPMTMEGYFNNPEATAATIEPDGFLHTGDLGSMSAAGICRIHGRQRDLIIRGGENIYPIEVEEALASHPTIALVGVVGLPDERMGQQVAAVVQLLPGAAADEAALQEHAARFISHYKVPKRWRFVEEMPMTASGKVRKVDLPPLFEQAEAAAG